MLVLFLILVTGTPPRPATTFSSSTEYYRLSRSSPLTCKRVAWLNLRTGETGQTYCLAEPRLQRILELMKKIPRSVSWIEQVDCHQVSGTRACKTSEGVTLSPIDWNASSYPR